jgi:hypothetical protein
MYCPRCGTLMQGGICPECGFPINRARKKKNPHGTCTELPSVGSSVLKKPHRIMMEHLCDPVEYVCSVCVAASEEP